MIFYILFWLIGFIIHIWLDVEMMSNRYYSSVRSTYNRYPTTLFLLYALILDIVMICTFSRKKAYNLLAPLISIYQALYEKRLKDLPIFRYISGRKKQSIDIFLYNLYLFSLRIFLLFFWLSLGIYFLPQDMKQTVESSLVIFIFINFQIIFIVLQVFCVRGMFGILQVFESRVNFLEQRSIKGYIHKPEDPNIQAAYEFLSHHTYPILTKRIKLFNKKMLFLITSTVLILSILPSIAFAILYGQVIMFHDFFTFQGFVDTIDVKLFYYSFSVSYSLPNDFIIEEVSEMFAKKGWPKILSVIQAVIQNIINIFILGYIAHVLTRIIQSKKTLHE